MERQLRDAYKSLGVRVGIDVRLPENACPPSGRTKTAMYLTELSRPFVALVRRNGSCRDHVWIVAADTRDDLLALIPRARMGPNGPIDGFDVLRDRDADCAR